MAMASANGPSSMSSLGTGCAEGFAAALNTLVALVHLRNRERLRKEKGKEATNLFAASSLLFLRAYLMVAKGSFGDA